MSIIKKTIPFIIITALILTVLALFSQMIMHAHSCGRQQLCQQPDPLDKVEHVQKDQGFINVPYINQLEAYPNGCESVSTVMVLKWLGTEITVDEFIDKYLDMGDTPSPSKGIGPDPDKVYCGGPRSDKGWGCNSPVIVNALKKFITTDQYTVEHSYGKSLEELCDDYIDRGIPVIVWVTVGMEDSSDISNYRYWTTPEGKEISYNRRLHCMVLCGYDEENYYFNDPMTQRLKAYTKADSEKAYSILGMQSVVVMQNA